jgi:hypothetical protein|tara:strand:- start:512 stop:709 length:198 start_codon:yes stop_codon:yes gene_type:complete
MDVVITPDLVSVEDTEKQQSEIKILLSDLKKEKVVPKNMKSAEFIVKCLTRGLNEYRKDIVIYDC